MGKEGMYGFLSHFHCFCHKGLSAGVGSFILYFKLEQIFLLCFILSLQFGFGGEISISWRWFKTGQTINVF